MFKNKILTTPIVMYNVPIVKYYRNKDKFKSALKNRKELKKLKLKDRRYSVLKSNTNLFEQGIDSLDFFSLIFDLEKKI